QANPISANTIVYSQIDGIHEATKLCRPANRGMLAPEQGSSGSGEITLPPPAASLSTGPAFGEVARMRRSALDFLGGTESMSLLQLSAILAVAARPLSAD